MIGVVEIALLKAFSGITSSHRRFVCHLTAQGKWLVQRPVEKLGREMWGPITEVHTDGGASAGLYLCSR